jgi:hypothetical protein
MRALLAALALGLLSACTPRAVIPDSEREKVRTELEGKPRWLRVAVYVAPFWDDHSKLLLSDSPLADLDLVERPDGTPLPPPPAERILVPGTPLRLIEVEFPTGWIIAKRVVVSPRYHPWALLEQAGEKRTPVLVLSQTDVTLDEVKTELDRILATDDPSSLFAALPAEQRDAISRKELVEGMSPRAVEMAWGFPERRRIDRPAATEEWTWPGGKRKAFFQDERLQRWDK